MKPLQEKGFKKEVAAIKTVWMDDRMQVVVSEMDELAATSARTSPPAGTRSPRSEARPLLEEHRQKTANLYCHGCGHLCETAARGCAGGHRACDTFGIYERLRQAIQEARALYAGPAADQPEPDRRARPSPIWKPPMPARPARHQPLEDGRPTGGPEPREALGPGGNWADCLAGACHPGGSDQSLTPRALASGGGGSFLARE